MTDWKLPPPTPGEGDRGRGLTKPKDLRCDERLGFTGGYSNFATFVANKLMFILLDSYLFSIWGSKIKLYA